jgi:sigma-B regulation protein RsbU (phosphoserine phosphatase)
MVKNRLNIADKIDFNEKLILVKYICLMTETKKSILRSAAPGRSYPNTVQKLARFFWHIDADQNILEFADELNLHPDIPVVCVVDEKERPLGVVRREHMFLILGKRFGREVMGKSSVREILEKAPVFPGETNILMILQFLNSGPGADMITTGNEYSILINAEGKFTGVLSLGDISDYMVDMTNKDIALAALLQERFLANADDIRDHRVAVNAWSSAVKGVGGDFYCIRRIDEEKFFASICDVSGKGIAASLVVSMVWGFLGAYTMTGGLKPMLINLNASIVQTFHLEKYLTGFFLIYDSSRRYLQIADMGHSHAVLIRENKVHHLKKAKVNLPLGIELTIDPLIFAFKIQAGDALLLYTDGIPEQDNPRGEEFGEKRLITLARACIRGKKQLDKLLPPAINDFRRHTPQHDDMTFLFFRF